MVGQHRIGIGSPQPSLLFRVTWLMLSTAMLLAATGCEASGSSERATSYTYAAVPVERVELYFRPVQRDYNLIATLAAEAKVAQFGSAAEAEAAVYEKLRHLAAKSGATAVIDIEVMPADISIAEEITAEAKAVRFR